MKGGNIIKVNYFGNRSPLVERITEIGNKKKLMGTNRHIQVVDLGGSEPPDIKHLLQKADKELPTIILSARRYNLNDHLGYLENELLNSLKHSIAYRLSPLDINFEFYRGWAGVTGTILTALHPEGVAWINTSDVAEAILIPEDQIYSRSGKAFELTGPRRISMNELKSIFENQLNTTIDLKCLDKETVKNRLRDNHVPEDILNWLVDYEFAVSDPRMKPTTDILTKILNRPANDVDFTYSSKVKSDSI